MGEKVDEEISKMLLEMLNPLAIKAAINVENELDARKIEADKFYLHQVERAKYDMEIARKRYMLVDPQNRLVATELEADWNLKIRELEKLKQEYEKKKEKNLKNAENYLESDIMQTVDDFANIWSSEKVSSRDKKRMLRLLIEDVSVKNDDKKIIANIRFRAGTCKTLFIEKKLPISEIRKTRTDIIRQVDELTQNHAPSEIAAILNQRGYCLWNGNIFNSKSVNYIIRTYSIKNRYRHLREKGCLSLKEKMLESNLSQAEIFQMRNEEKIVFYKVTDRDEYLYEPQNINKYLTKNQS